MKLIIKKTDLLNQPCPRYKSLPTKFDALEEIRKRGNFYEDVAWLISNCEFAQTLEMLEYYKSLNPSYKYVRWLISNCEFAQTEEMLDYYNSLNPSYEDVHWLISDCEFARINKNILI